MKQGKKRGFWCASGCPVFGVFQDVFASAKRSSNWRHEPENWANRLVKSTCIRISLPRLMCHILGTSCKSGLLFQKRDHRVFCSRKTSTKSLPFPHNLGSIDGATWCTFGGKKTNFSTISILGNFVVKKTAFRHIGTDREQKPENETGRETRFLVCPRMSGFWCVPGCLCLDKAII